MNAIGIALMIATLLACMAVSVREPAVKPVRIEREEREEHR